MTQPQPYLVEHRIADGIAPSMRRAFLDAVKNAKEQFSLPAIIRAIENGDQVERVVPFRTMEVLFFRAFRTMLGETLLEAAKAHGKLLPRLQKDIFSLGFSFDLTNPAAIAWIRQHAFDLVDGVSDQTREALRQILQRSFAGEMTVPQQAQFIRDLVGLDVRRANALDKFRQQLAASDLSDARSETLLVQYQKRLLAARATAIARTESITVSSNGQHQLWLKALTDGFLDDTVRRRPIITPDSRLCPLCSPMPSNPANTVRLNEPFTRGDGVKVMNPAFHTHCRCSQGLVFPPYPPVPSIVPAFAGAAGPPRRTRKPHLR